MISLSEIDELAKRFESSSTEEILAWAWAKFGKRAAIGTSFQGTGIVMMHLAKRAQLPFPIFTLDTGLLFPETLALKKALEDFLQLKIESLEPDNTVEQQAQVYGPELWKRDPDSCCMMRKVEPLQKKLENLDCWISGIRRQQSESRAQIRIIELYEFDSIRNHEIIQLNPMANWTREAVWNHIKQNKLPYNPLYSQGYRSIGCMPCTRKSTIDQDERAGRWTGFNKTECGIHTFMKKKGD